jgi:ABC-2 type transport system permease protein
MNKKHFFFMTGINVLILREYQRIKMEPSRLFGMMLQPLMFWLIFGLGFNNNFSYKSNYIDISYKAYFFPGILALILLFASIYSTLTLVEDKKCGFFKFMLCSPVGIASAIVGKILATALVGFTQSLLFLPFAFFIFNFTNKMFLLVPLLLLGSLVFSVLGVIFAVISPSSSAFHALMSIILIPMWLLSEAMFPLKNTVLNFILFINPMSYLVKTLRIILLNTDEKLSFNIIVLAIFFILLSFILYLLIKNKPLE